MERTRAPPDDQMLIDELQVERKMKEMLELSIYEMRNTIADLERKLKSVDDEGSEWKTRYETQIELNKQLERQSHVLQEKSEYIRGNPTDRLSSIRSYDDMSVIPLRSCASCLSVNNCGGNTQPGLIGSLNQYLKHLEDEKSLMDNQLKDFELRIEQEAKAYYKINDERRMYIAEIAQTSAARDSAKKQTIYPAHVTREKQEHKGMPTTSTNQKRADRKKNTIRNTVQGKTLRK
ncbi:coiled-coil domain-containing protein 169 [Mixophyes fleayi]|uniref:coiled-coil domain-containing protein 169 n=1 Tax=Mixophyes fleayi TaxID=3061075 RepID=UPI003F4E0EAC